MKKFCDLFSNRRGNVAAPGAIFFVVFMIVGGGALDLMSVTKQESMLQDLADHAALAAVNELAVVGQDEERIREIAAAYIDHADMRIAQIDTRVNLANREVSVDIKALPDTNFPTAFSKLEAINVSATAKLSGQGGNICMIGLSPISKSTLRLRSRAKITAESCALYSNSTSKSSMWVASTASVKADLICIAGGYHGSSDELAATTIEDCTPVADPLAERIAPTYAGCDYQSKTVTANEKLQPGVYCGGITVDGGEADLESGDYILTGGPLAVRNGGTLQGEYVGFFLSGADATIQFDYEANVSLTAPKSGSMTGLLFYSTEYEFSEKNNAAKKRKNDGVKKPAHFIRSDNARRLVGTIYLPSGKLLIDGRNPIADRSEYTVIIADTFELQDGPNLVLKADYHLSDIPVPDGVGPVADKEARLVN